MAQKKKTYLKILTPPDDLNEIKKKVRRFRLTKLRRILVIVVLLILAVSGTYLLMKNQSYEHARTASEYPSSTSDTSSYAQFADGIVRYNRDGVAFLNRRNEEQWIQPTQLGNPVIVINDEAFAVADNGGNTILVFTEDGLKGEIETTLPIERVSVSNQGIVSAILRNDSTPLIISYDAAGNILVEQQASWSTTGYPVALEMSDDGNTLAVSYVYVEGAAMKSRIIFYNFGETGQNSQDNIVFSEDYDSTLFADIFFMGDDRCVAVGDDSFIIYSGTQSPQVERKVEINQEIQSVFHSDRYIGFILLNQEKSGYEVRLYNRLGDQVTSREISGLYEKVKIDGDEVIMTDGSRCCIVTVNGIIKYEGDIDFTVSEIFRAPGLNRYYVINVDELRIIYLTK